METVFKRIAEEQIIKRFTNNESMSISTQKKMLKDYAKAQQFSELPVYVDDGYSGTNYDRLLFQIAY